MQKKPAISVLLFSAPALMLAVLVLFTNFQFFLQGSVGILTDYLKDSFRADAAMMSILSSSFFYSFILLQIPAGMIIDRFGVRKVATIACGFVAAGCWVFSQSSTLGWGVLGRVLMGIGGAFSFISMLKTIKEWFAPQQFPILLGIVETVGMASTAGINTAVSEVSGFWGWRVAMMGCASTLTLLTGILWWRVRDQKAVSNGDTKVSGESFWVRSRRLLAKPELWWCGIFAGCNFSVVTVFTYLWCVPFLTQGYGLPEVTAVMLCSFIYLGIALGSPLCGWLSNRVAFSTLMLRGALVSLTLFSILLYVPALPIWVMGVLIFLLGITISTYHLSFIYVSRSVPNSVQGTANGFVNMMTMIGAPLLQPVVGFFLSYEKDGKIFDGAETYGLWDFRLALTLIPICLLASVFCAKAMRGK